MNYRKKAKTKGRKTKLTTYFKEIIERSLYKAWSPEQIVGRSLKGIVSFKTIYNWIYDGFIDVEFDVLRRKSKSRKTKDNRGEFNIGKKISQRPRNVKKRIAFGHWELDTILSSREDNKGSIATFTEMKTRMYIAIKIPNRSQDSMFKAIK